MYILINRRIFTEDPAVRFSRTFKCEKDIWRQVWGRYKLKSYTEEDAREYLSMLLKKEIAHRCFKRWIKRTEVYIKSQIALKEGVKKVNLKYFDPYQDFVENEIMKNL